MGMPLLEAFAVVFAILYLILAARENIWCWLCGLLSTILYLVVFYRVSLQSEVILQFFYIVMSVLGFFIWKNKNNQSLPIITLSAGKHIFYCVLTAGAAVPLGYYTQKYLGASFPYLDAFVTTFSILTTIFVMYKVLENWIYWFIIDGTAIYLYWEKQLYFTVLLFIIYEVIVIAGYIKWKKAYQYQNRG